MPNDVVMFYPKDNVKVAGKQYPGNRWAGPLSPDEIEDVIGAGLVHRTARVPVGSDGKPDPEVLADAARDLTQ